MSERWLTIEEAREAIKLRLETSAGRAEAVLETARKSGEVRFSNPADPVLLMADDGLVGMDMRPGAQNKGGVDRDGKPTFHRLAARNSDCISKEDLLDWLDRNHPLEPAVISTRYPGDAALLEEGRRMLAGGMEKRAVARALAARADGTATFESKVDRLRKAL
jgi:hypothetical protein